jgi:hypothetical protein
LTPAGLCGLRFTLISGRRFAWCDICRSCIDFVLFFVFVQKFYFALSAVRMECPACTFLNEVDGAMECEMCFSPLFVKKAKTAEVKLAVPDLSADALLKELEMEEQEEGVNSDLACLICKKRLLHEYFVLPECATEHRLCSGCLKQLSIESENGKKKQKKRPLLVGAAEKASPSVTFVVINLFLVWL